MTEVRTLKVSYSTCSKGYSTGRIVLPSKWLNDMNISKDDREVKVTYEDNKIVIEKLKS